MQSLLRKSVHPAARCVAPSRHHLPVPVLRRLAVCYATEQESTSTSVQDGPSTSNNNNSADITKELNKFTRQTAATFAPRSSTAKGKNPAVKGSVLYNVFELQAWLSLIVGGLLSYNVLYPTDEPSIPRLLGMWSIWMFTIPSLRAKDCTPREKDALNVLFVAMPLVNIILPLVYKSFAFIFVADVAMVMGVYSWKGVWREVYGLPIGAELPPAAPADGPAQDEQSQ